MLKTSIIRLDSLRPRNIIEARLVRDIAYCIVLSSLSEAADSVKEDLLLSINYDMLKQPDVFDYKVGRNEDEEMRRVKSMLFKEMKDMLSHYSMLVDLTRDHYFNVNFAMVSTNTISVTYEVLELTHS